MGRPLLTIGMATFDDHEGLWATLQSLRLHHAEFMRDVELLVVDNNPDGPHGEANRNLFGWIKGDVAAARYVPAGDVRGTSAPRDRVFREATGEYVLCLDCHVLLPPGSLAALLAHYKKHPGTRDLLSGPMVYDDLRNRATHFADEWRGEMWGTWATDARGDPFRVDADGNPAFTGDPFEIPAMGLGLFSCRKDAWLGFNPDFRGFGGEEWYIHEKYRQAGHKCLCLPGLTWVHRFGRPGGVKYPLSRWHKVRNYVIGHRELGLKLDRVHEHFVKSGLFPQEHWDLILAGAVDEPGQQPAHVQPKKSCGACGSGAKPSRPQPPEGASLEDIFAFVKATPRDLDQHADFIAHVASEADSVVAFVKRREWNALLAAGRPDSLTVYQTEDDPLLTLVHEQAAAAGLEYFTRTGANADSLTAPPAGDVDLLVLDTVHHADRLWQELQRHGKGARRILLRGTGAFGEQAEGGGPGLLHAVRRWVKENPEWTVAEHRREQYGMMLLSRLPQDKKELPSLWRQGVSAAKASWRAGTSVLTGYGPLKDTEVQDRRLALCLVCPSHTDGRCAECGCPVDKKSSYGTESCPLGHWHQEAK